MNRRAALTILASSIAAAGTVDDFDDKVLSFNHAWNAFFRAHFGCPQEATDPKECKPQFGSLAVKEFTKAAKEGRKLFAQ